MKARFAIGNMAALINDWLVLDTKTGGPATFNHVLQVSLSFADADDLVDSLDNVHPHKSKSKIH
jgi:hypothetical protein